MESYKKGLYVLQFYVSESRVLAYLLLWHPHMEKCREHGWPSISDTNKLWGNLLLHAHFTIVCRSWLMHFCTYVFTLNWTVIFHPHFVYWDLTAHVCTWFYMLSRGFSIPIPLDVSHVFKYEVTCVYSMLYQVLASHWTSPMWLGDAFMILMS